MILVQKTKSGDIDLSDLRAQINSDGAITPVCSGIAREGDDLQIAFDSALSGAEDTALDALLAGYAFPLALLKDQLIESIKQYRNYQIEYVLTFEHPDASGKLFGVSFSDQHNFHGLYTARALASYPVNIRTEDELQEHAIADATEVETIFAKVFSTVNTEIATAAAAIKGVVDAVDATAAQAAHDAYVP